MHGLRSRSTLLDIKALESAAAHGSKELKERELVRGVGGIEESILWRKELGLKTAGQG